MQKTSVPGTTRAGVVEMVRTWEPDGEPRATAVFVHGLAEHSDRHDRTATRLAEEGVTVTGFDLVGFGASGGRRGHIDSWTTYLDQIEDHVVAARSGTLPLVLMGQSMGGLLALEYCLSERPAPDAAVVISPALGGGNAIQRGMTPVLARIAPTVLIPNYLKGEQLSRDPAVGEAYFADPLVFSKSTPTLGRELFAAMRRVGAHIATLRVPALVIAGGLDTIVPPQSSLALGAVAGVERKLYPGLRHEPLNEPEAPDVLDEIVAWLGARLTTAG